eukprot:4109347-Amphidinium_carterae.3
MSSRCCTPFLSRFAEIEIIALQHWRVTETSRVVSIRVCCIVSAVVLEGHKGLGRRREVVTREQQLLERQAECALAERVLSTEKPPKHPAVSMYKRTYGALDPERSSNVDWLRCVDRMMVHSVGW